MRISRLNLVLCPALVLGLTACSFIPNNYVPSFVKPYRVDIQQGNFITQDDASKLQTGMTKEQVRFILGTPLLNDAFHTNRWDYVYRLLRADGQSSQSRYTVIFENDRVVRHGGENLPTNPTDLLGPEGNTIPTTQPLPTENPTEASKEPESSVGGTDRAPVLQ